MKMFFFPLGSTSEPLRLLIRGDAFPVAGDSWTQMCITILNHRHRARRMTHTWPIAVVWAPDKDMRFLSKLLAPLYEVCLVLRVSEPLA